MYFRLLFLTLCVVRLEIPVNMIMEQTVFNFSKHYEGTNSNNEYTQYFYTEKESQIARYQTVINPSQCPNMGVEFQEFVSHLNLSDLDVNYLMDEMF